MGNLLMDEIEAGFQKLIGRIRESETERESLKEEVLKQEVALFERMIKLAAPLVKNIGIHMLLRGKQDTKGELYDTSFHKKKMIVLGKTDPSEYRPDNMAKKVEDQFCVLSEDGKLYEMMFSFDGFIVDSYANPISPKEAIGRYGYDPMYMLYHALHDYLKGQEDLIASLKLVLEFLFPRPDFPPPPPREKD
jgi:hypothetical protein